MKKEDTQPKRYCQTCGAIEGKKIPVTIHNILPTPEEGKINLCPTCALLLFINFYNQFLRATLKPFLIENRMLKEKLKKYG